MNKLPLLMILLIISCAPNLSGNDAYQPSLEAFEVSEKCPNICWLGIHPETTSVDEAIAVIMKSKQINRKEFLQISDVSLQTVWGYTDKTGTFSSDVWINFDSGFVRSIHFGQLAPFSIKDFVSMLGEPDKILIKIDHTIDGGDLVTYSLYFSSRKASLFVYPGSWDGPNPDDYITSLVLNSEFTYPKIFEGEKQQSWIGYGHLQDYLPEQELPSGTYTPPETGPSYWP